MHRPTDDAGVPICQPPSPGTCTFVGQDIQSNLGIATSDLRAQFPALVFLHSFFLLLPHHTSRLFPPLAPSPLFTTPSLPTLRASIATSLDNCDTKAYFAKHNVISYHLRLYTMTDTEIQQGDKGMRPLLLPFNLNLNAWRRVWQASARRIMRTSACRWRITARSCGPDRIYDTCLLDIRDPR